MTRTSKKSRDGDELRKRRPSYPTKFGNSLSSKAELHPLLPYNSEKPRKPARQRRFPPSSSRNLIKTSVNSWFLAPYSRKRGDARNKYGKRDGNASVPVYRPRLSALHRSFRNYPSSFLMTASFSITKSEMPAV